MPEVIHVSLEELDVINKSCRKGSCLFHIIPLPKFPAVRRTPKHKLNYTESIIKWKKSVKLSEEVKQSRRYIGEINRSKINLEDVYSNA